MGLIPESGRSPGERNASPLQYSCLENLTDRGAWQVVVGGVAKSWTKLSTDTMTKKKKTLLCKDLKNLNYTLKQPREAITAEISNIRNILYDNHGMQLKHCIT